MSAKCPLSRYVLGAGLAGRQLSPQRTLLLILHNETPLWWRWLEKPHLRPVSRSGCSSRPLSRLKGLMGLRPPSLRAPRLLWVNENACDCQQLLRALGLGFSVAMGSKMNKEDKSGCCPGILSAPPLSSSAWENHLLMLPGKISLEKEILLPPVSTYWFSLH